MNEPHDAPRAATFARPRAACPLIRHLSCRLTPVLARLPLTPNQITLASIALGLGTAACLATGRWDMSVGGAALLVVSYALDNCDGEIARLKGLETRLGAHLDTLGDAVVHAVLFVALGTGAVRGGADSIWLWLGYVAAAGAAFNYLIGLWLDARATAPAEAEAAPPAGPGARFAYVFRELFRADFCFVLLALSFFDLAWLLLPVGAVGAQAYWIAAFASGARRYHV